MKRFELPQEILAVLKRFSDARIEAYVVGGCVRDLVRGVSPHDYDIATAAMPEEVSELFSDCHVIPTGIQHGTVTVVFQDLPVEITTFRIDGEYADARHPQSVSFTSSFQADCARRDFTVNAMGYAASTGLVDFYGGQKDVLARLIRTVGDPEQRFREDALRMLRALRFSSTFDFDIDKKTSFCIHEMAHMLTKVSVERVYVELCKLLCGVRAQAVLEEFSDVFAILLPEIADCIGFDQKNHHHIYNVYTHMTHAVSNIESEKILRLAAFLHDIGKPETFSLDEKDIGHFYGHAARSADKSKQLLSRLHAERDTIQKVSFLIKHHDDMLSPTKVDIRRFLSKYGEEFFFHFLALKRADNFAQSPEFFFRQKEYDECELIANEILAESPCLTLNQLQINGTDVMACGVPRGQLVGEILKSLHEEVLTERLPNQRDVLLKRAMEMVKESDK